MKMVPLGEVAIINPRSPKLQHSEDIAFVGMAQLDATSAVAVPREYGPYSNFAHGYTPLEDGDILAAKITPCWENGKIGQAHLGVRYGMGSTEFHVIRPTDAIDARYALHFIRQSKIRDTGTLRMTGSAGQRRVPTKYLSDLTTPLPPLDEQRRIAAILDKADAIRQKRRQAIAHLDTLAQSMFHDLFGEHNDFVELQTVCDKITDGTHQSPQWDNSGIPFLFVSNITSGEINFSTKKFISEGTWSDLTRRTPIEIGDVLYSTVGSFGIPAVVRTTSRFAFQRHIAHIKPVAEKIDSDFLSAQLASAFVLRQAKRAARGIAQPTINLADIKKYSIIVPPIEEQRRFSLLHTRLRTQKRILHQSAQELDQLFASLQSLAFRGEL